MKTTRLRPWVIISIMIIFLIGIIYYSYKILIWFNNINENKKVLEKIEEKIKITIDNFDESDKILTLSSCIGDGKKRVVLHAKLLGKD